MIKTKCTKYPIVCSCNFLDVVYMNYEEWEQQVKAELLSRFNFVLPEISFIETDLYRFFDRGRDAIYTARVFNKWYNKKQ